MSRMAAATLMRIWENAIAKCLKELVQRRTGVIAEDLSFEFWSRAIGEMYYLISNKSKKEWGYASKETRLAAFEGKFFSFDNFNEEIFGQQLLLEVNGTEH